MIFDRLNQKGNYIKLHAFDNGYNEPFSGHL